jgi:hypothetical protein
MAPRLLTAVQPSQSNGRTAVLTLHDVNDHPDGAVALSELVTTYVISEVAGGLLLSQRDVDCRLFIYDLAAFLSAARRNADRRARMANAASGPAGKHYSAEDTAPGTFDLASARQVIAALEDRISRLQGIRKEIGDQREQWRQRAMLAEAKLNGSDETERDGGDGRYQVLRRFLAKQFHPDHAPGSGIEKVMRGEIFKEIWTEISRIDTSDR